MPGDVLATARGLADSAVNVVAAALDLGLAALVGARGVRQASLLAGACIGAACVAATLARRRGQGRREVRRAALVGSV